MGDQVFGVSFDTPLTSAQDYARAVLERRPHALVIPAGRDTPITGPIPLETPMTVLDRDGRPTGMTADDIF